MRVFHPPWTSKVSPVDARDFLQEQVQPTLRSGRQFARRLSQPPANGAVACRAHLDRLGFLCVFDPTRDRNLKNSRGLIAASYATTNLGSESSAIPVVNVHVFGMRHVPARAANRVGRAGG